MMQVMPRPCACEVVAGHTPASSPASSKADTGILSVDFWGAKRRIPVSAAEDWPGCDL